MTSDELISLGVTSSILTPVDETFLDKDGNIVSVERFTPREIAEALLPDMTTVPMTDEEIERFMRG